TPTKSCSAHRTVTISPMLPNPAPVMPDSRHAVTWEPPAAVTCPRTCSITPHPIESDAKQQRLWLENGKPARGPNARLRPQCRLLTEPPDTHRGRLIVTERCLLQDHSDHLELVSNQSDPRARRASVESHCLHGPACPDAPCF